MSALDEACRAVVAGIDGARACGLLDLDTGMLLGLHGVAPQDCALADSVAAAMLEVFRGPQVAAVERAVREQYGLVEDGAHYVREVYVGSEQAAHFARTLRDGRAVLVLVTSQTGNIGLGWAQLRAAIPAVEGLVP